MSKAEQAAAAGGEAPQPRRERPQPTNTTGVVRSVVGADMFVAQARDGKEMTVQLSGVHGPRMGNASRAAEPFAWEARDFLRKKIIGQQLKISVVATGGGDKHFANVYLGDEDVVATMVRSGWCRVNPNAKGKRAEELSALETEARENKRGVFQPASAARPTTLAATKPYAVYEQCAKEHKGRGVAAVVEGVWSGTTLRTTFLPPFAQVMLAVAGVQAPAVRWVPERRAHEELEPCGLEAQAFVEHHVLHRDVTVELKSYEKNDTLVGVVRLLGRDLGAELVKMGYARVVPGKGIKDDSDYYKQLLALQSAAVAKKAGMWKHQAAPAAAAAAAAASPAAAAAGEGKAQKASRSKFTATVVDIANGGTIVVEHEDGTAQRIMLASLRVPRPATRPEPRGKGKGKGADSTTASKEDLYMLQLAADGREALRKSVFGRPVRCERRYERAGDQSQQQSGEPAVFWDVYAGDKNIALPLVEAGLLVVVQHRGEDPRSHDYDELCLAEKHAQERRAGVHMKAEHARLRRVTDTTLDQSRAAAAALLPHLTGRITGVVDYVFSATRVKVYVPAQSSLVAFVCSGVQAPHHTDKNKDMAALAEQGLRAMRKLAHMRDIVITSVDGVDNRGNFVATMECGGTNLSAMLVRDGLAWVNDGPRRSPISAQLEQLEADARAAKRGVWAFYKPPQSSADAPDGDGSGDGKEKKREFFEATVTELGEYGTFYLQKKSDEAVLDDMTERLCALAEEAAEELKSSGRSSAPEPKPKQLVMARFNDGKWYRARCLGAAAAGSVEVQYIDFGTVEKCARSRVLPLPPELGKQAPLARKARLAFVKPPSKGDADAADFLDEFEDLTAGKTLTATVAYHDDGVLAVLLADDKTHVNVALVRDGLATLDKRRVPPTAAGSEFDALRDAQESARTERLHLWRYGDADDEDDAPAPSRGRRY